MIKFNFKRGSATKKGVVGTRRLITKDHNVYKYLFDSLGRRRSKEETKELIDKDRSKL